MQTKQRPLLDERGVSCNINCNMSADRTRMMSGETWSNKLVSFEESLAEGITTSEILQNAARD
jgi:hypothetical protein